MNFQEHCTQYIQKIDQTRSSPDATPELSLLPELRTFLQNIASEYFDQTEIVFTLEPRNINQIGRPDIIAREGLLLTLGYIEAEKYGTDLNNLTRHAREQNRLDSPKTLHQRRFSPISMQCFIVQPTVNGIMSF